MRWLYRSGRLYSSVLLTSIFVGNWMLKCDKELLSLSEKVAISQKGETEISDNKGEPEKYLKAVGLPGGYPYCAAGIYWSFSVAADSLGLPKSKIPLLKTAGANAMYNHAKREGVKTNSPPKRHSLLVWRSKNSWRGHIERVIKAKDKGILKTIAFNVSKNGKEGVFIKTRFLKHPLGRLLFRGAIILEGK